MSEEYKPDYLNSEEAEPTPAELFGMMKEMLSRIEKEVVAMGETIDSVSSVVLDDMFCVIPNDVYKEWESKQVNKKS